MCLYVEYPGWRAAVLQANFHVHRVALTSFVMERTSSGYQVKSDWQINTTSSPENGR
jgi:hypothetical protein